jgi:Ca2+-binding EF-hand superfamily protein
VRQTSGDSAAPTPRDGSSYSVSLMREPALRGALAAATRNMGDGEVEALFNRYDSDGSGYIDADELRELLRTLEFEASAAEVAQMLGQADLNHDHAIDLQEFRLLMGRDTAAR